MNKVCYFFTKLLPKVQTPLSCHFLTNLSFLDLKVKGIKASCFCHFFESHIFKGLPYIQNNFFPINQCYVNLIITSAKEFIGEEGKHFSSRQHITNYFIRVHNLLTHSSFVKYLFLIYCFYFFVILICFFNILNIFKLPSTVYESFILQHLHPYKYYLFFNHY